MSRTRTVRPFKGALHHTLNRTLVGGVADDHARPVVGLDAIVVPSARDPQHLLSSLALKHLSVNGALRDIPIVLLRTSGAPDHSGRFDSPAARLALNVVVVDVPVDYTLPDLPLQTEEIAAAEGAVFADTALKRNIGLLLAAKLRWRNLFFLDDDVLGLDDAVLTRTRSLLYQHEAVGWAFVGNEHATPDNSMVCHAHRICGGLQDTFIGAGALAVRPSPAIPFFPSIYNEDWLFLAPLIERRSVALAGELHQLPFDPFNRPERAANQEFGEVLAVGLFGLLHEGRPLVDGGGADYWGEVLARRQDLLDGLRRALAGRRDPSSRAALKAVQSAGSARADHWPVALAQYCQAWQSDLRDWRSYLAKIPSTATSLPAALASLGLTERSRLTPGVG